MTPPHYVQGAVLCENVGMSKDISTVPGKTYVVTLSQAGELSGRTDAGEALVLAGSDAAGQVSFQAISQVTTCSDDGATVLPFCDAPLPIGVDGGASAKQLAGMVDSALYEESPFELATPAGTANATCHYVELDAHHVPQGRLQSISFRCRSGGNPSTLSYLAVWELGEDGETWSYLGSSTNNPGQAMNQTKTWEFAPGEVSLAGRKLRILAQAERSDVWEAERQLGVYVSTPSEEDTTQCFNNGTGYAFLPEMSITVLQPVPKFVAKGDFDAHVTSAAVHLTATEREWLDAVRGGSQELALPVLKINGTQGSSIMVVRGNQTNVTVTGSAMTFNVPKFWVMGDYPALYSYNTSTGVTKVWFAATQDAVSLAALGLAEPGVYAGEASMPLFLRGSVLNINGAEIDVAALAELLARKDELLALLNAG